jgi:sulfotransferase family protein
MALPSARNVNFVTAYPKSGITFLSHMLFRALFEQADDTLKINSDYIIDIHQYLDRVIPDESRLFHVKSHFAFGPDLPLRGRARRAILLVRDPIDVMMSSWDYKHLTGEGDLHLVSEAVRAPLFRRFVADWISSGGQAYQWTDSWVNNVNSWLDQQEIPFLVVRYEALKAGPAEELRRIMAFLDRPVAQERVLAAVEFGDVNRMRETEERAIAAGGAGLFAGYDKGYRFIGRLHQNAYRTALDDEQRDLADAVFGPTIDKIMQHTKH